MLYVWGLHLKSILCRNQGNVLKGIDNWSVVARSVVQGSPFDTILFPYKLCVTEKRTYVNKLKFPILLRFCCQYPLIIYLG